MFRLRSTNKRRGMTLPEMMISVAIFTFIGLFVTFTTVIISKQVHRSIRSIPAEQKAYRALDQIRQELMSATVGTVTVDNDQKGITYQNPSRTNASRIWLASGGKCMWDPDTTASNDELEMGNNLTNCTFSLPANPKLVEIEVETTGKNKDNENVPVTYTDVIVLRN